ncbi:phospholipase D1-like [Dendronephthya gigantea]|uniref:phospholipase D1-like n=1 Tax=Dendronephthya gigantea TaxID=151771 RepID=UPI00106AF4C2|nr:phospholipase D1-like [Dendronephthya gigantea]
MKDSFIAYLDPGNQEVRGVLLLDEKFSVEIPPHLSRGLLIRNRERELTVFCWTHRKQSEWMAEMVRTMADTGSIWTKNNAFDSYAPQRQKIPAQWFVDGEEYFYSVSQALEEAKEEIFITDWWFSPELHMVRPSTENDHWRLDRILQRKAEAGVMIYVLIYKEMEMALTIKSIYSKTALLKLHPTNIKVLRHPDHTPGKTGIFYWAHHEKIVCIDQKVAFLGGLDLCYGRWDNCRHFLTDCDSEFVPSTYSKTEKVIANIGNIFMTATANAIPNFSEITEERTKTKEAKISRSRKLLGRARLWRGKDYSNPIIKDFVDLHKPEQDIIDRSSTNRMPWHDVAVCIWGQVARDVARHFIQRWNFTKLEKKKADSFFPLLLPKTYTGLVDTAPDGLKTSNINCQVLRSVGEWSAGCPSESSIYNAYIHLIKTSKHYIYIENQFFITSLPPDVKNIVGDALVERITRAHNNGENFKVFIVMPLLPAFEGEIGDASGTSICVITHWNYMSLCRGETSLIEKLRKNAVDKPFDYLSICSLRKHEEFGATPITELIYVHSKVMIVDDRYTIIGSANINDRSLLGKRDSEIAILAEDCEFIESKMNGKKYQSGVFSSSLRHRLMNEHLGLLESVDEKDDSVVKDPISESFFKDVWSAIADANTRIYEQVFHALPSDAVEHFSELPQYKNLQGLAVKDPEQARKELEKIQGHLVNMPLKFLQNSDLRPPSGSKEALVPVKIFT